uniref:Replication protein A C-terminal domain-containing protein n=1 Tax=Chlamydomonas leiostraca TaxID=1034604 RepID=A0A7S0WF32_9CHLO|mmetsp:Transcript_12215/g.29764  ORF Transcript_12215/g.29764 Transcript_12215/m.29764 type:complete len:278 (+) Transcript_12215:110-943(+)
MALDIGASQFAGGGFMPSPQGGHDAGYGGGGAKASANKINTVRHVSIKQILRENSNGGEDFVVDGRELSSITFVGRITSMQEQATRILLKVHDGTGQMDVMVWVNDSEPEMLARQRAEMTVGRYVRVYGNLKRYNSQLSVTGYTVRPVTDYNDITYQNLQVIYQHLHITRGSAPTGIPMGGMAAPQQQWGSHAAKPAAAPAPVMGGGAGGDLNSTIAEIFRLPASREGEGLNIGMVLDALRARGINAQPPAVSAALEHLTNEGQLYTTCDENHWKIV